VVIFVQPQPSSTTLAETPGGGDGLAAGRVDAPAGPPADARPDPPADAPAGPPADLETAAVGRITCSFASRNFDQRTRMSTVQLHGMRSVIVDWV
jgi:hypothetical protein